MMEVGAWKGGVGGGVGEGAAMNTVAAPDMMLCRAKDECAHCDRMMMSER